MKETLFTGSGVAIVTPFTESGVDYDRLSKLIEYHVQSKTDAIVVCGTTGEASTMDDEEHLNVIKFTVKCVDKRIPVIAGTGSNYTDHGIYLSQEAEKAGVDGLLLVTPYYNKTSQKGLIEHYRKTAGSVNIPIMLYNVPSRTGVNITPQTLKTLSLIDNIVAIKEASGDIAQVAEMAALCGDSIDIYSGNDNMIVPLLSLGGKGVVSVVANIAPEETHDLVEKYLAGDVEGSKEIQLKMFKLIQSLFIEVNPIPIKTAMNLLGFNVGKLRLPLYEMEEKNVEILKNTLIEYGFKL